MSAHTLFLSPVLLPSGAHARAAQSPNAAQAAKFLDRDVSQPLALLAAETILLGVVHALPQSAGAYTHAQSRTESIYGAERATD
jgi:hypothetical protein